jgi:hypothetical protein
MVPDLQMDLSWSRVRSFLPFDLDGEAVASGCLERRRAVKDGEALARVLLMCGLPGATFEKVSAWAKSSRIARMNASAVFFRFCDSEPFLERLFRSLLVHSVGRVPLEVGGFRCVIVDATTVSGPGATGTDQRIHVVFDPASQMPLSAQITDARGGERLDLHEFEPGTLILGDRGYGHTNGVLSMLARGCHVLVRFEFDSVRFLDASGRRINSSRAEAELPTSGAHERSVWLVGRDEPLRAIGCRNHEGTPVWLLTDLSKSALSVEEACAAYGWRWQIELYFKRLKSILDLASIPTRAGPTARPWIWAKLILASLSILLSEERFFPWGVPTGHQRLETNGFRGLATDSGSARALCAATKKAQETPRTHPQATLLVEA